MLLNMSCIFLLFFCVLSFADNMERPRLIVTTTLQKPYFFFRDGANTILEGNDRYGGYIPELVGKVASFAAFNYEFRLVDDGRHGSRQDYKGNWDGMMGEVIGEIADIAAGPLLITYKRAKYVDFTTSFMHLHLTAIVRKDAKLSQFVDLFNSSRLDYGVVRGSKAMEWFRKSKHAPYNFMWAKIHSNDDSNVDTIAAGINRVKDGGFALIASQEEADYVLRKECELRTVGRALGTERGFALAVRKYSELRERLDHALSELRQRGVIRELYEKWFLMRQCPSTDGKTILPQPDYSQARSTYERETDSACDCKHPLALLIAVLAITVFTLI